MDPGRLMSTLFASGLGIALLSGCAAEDGSAPQVVAERFAAAMATRDGSRACDLLAPETRSEVAQSAGADCATAILEEGVSLPDTAESSVTFGTMSQVTFGGEAVFLSEFPSGWRVVAAGCSPVPGRPYDCQVTGG
jgi:hypothetical protein